MSDPDYRAAPLKAISRQMIVEICRRLSTFGDLREYLYAGLGGVHFVDFELMHRSLGVEQMVTIENKVPAARIEFNKPYDQIRLLHGDTSTVLVDIEDLGDRRSIVWLDYVDPLSQSELGDIAYVVSKAQSGSALFATFNCHCGVNASIEQIEDRLGEFITPGLKLADCQVHGLGDEHVAACERRIQSILSDRPEDLNYTRVLDLRYKDSSRMQVAGWILTQSDDVEKLEQSRLQDLAFTPAGAGGEPVKLVSPELTDREWSNFVQQLPKREAEDLVPPHDHLPATTASNFLSVYRFGQRPA
jgi:hypothetical protein